MRLKSLKIDGFKSFADEIELMFENGTTAIVGPNGCGKSNISDAIRWVLGEQSSRSLRCARMEDVIFNGGSDGKPKGSAFVSLRFSNEQGLLPMDSPEITISRQLLRSGESNYFINGSPCLLRDIQNLFIDTGIGTNAYSLMEQNKIDIILNTKPQERRFLFDEVAGINKYKQKKKAALKKLEETEANLTRINDIITELERETESLKEQAATAERYLSLQKQIKLADIERARRRFVNLSENLADVRRKYEETAQKIAERMEEIGAQEVAIESFNARRGEIDVEAADLIQRIRKVESEIERTESNIAIYKDRQIAMAQQRERAQSEIENIEKRHKELDEAINVRAQERKKLEIELQLEGSKLKAHETFIEQINARVAEVRELIEKLKGEMVTSLDQKSRYQNELSSLKSKLEYSQGRLKRLSTDEDGLSSELEQVKLQLDESNRKKQLLESEIASMSADLSEVESQLSADLDLRRKLEAEASGIQQSLGLSTSRLTSLRDLQDNYEGYYSGVRAVMKASELEPEEYGGICGVVGELITTDPEYEVAIEVALGSGIQNVIVETAEDAQKAVDLLKRAKAGRVTFLPLDILRPRRLGGYNDILKMKGVIGLASELVSFDPFYQKAVDYLLGGTIVVDDLDTAIFISRKHRTSYRFVTLEGEVLNASGAITGGSTKSVISGLLGRGREIEELEMKVEKLTLRLREKDEEKKRLNEKISLFQKRKQELVTASQEKRVLLAGVTKEFQGLEQRYERLSRELNVLRSEGQVIKRDLDELLVRKEESEEKLKEAERAYTSSSRKSQRLTEQIDSELAKRDEIEKLCGEKRVELATIKEKIRSIDEATESMEAEKKRLDERMIEFQKAIESSQQSQEEIGERIKEEQQKFLRLEQDLFDLNEKSAALEREKEELLQKIDETERKLRALRRGISVIEARRHELDVNRTELQIQIDALRTSIREKYQMEIEDATPEAEELSDDDLNLMIDDLKQKIGAMGTVNLKAIEEYENHKRRLDFMIGQRDDLVDARASIYRAIDRINATSRKMFLESFNEVNKNFKESFRELFEGGEAELVLNGDDVLECGVEIIAHPPGKKPGSISLLSGGERTLVAIALLFGIFRLKPSPFCLLDEVDAALDEANILRFTRVVKKFSRDNQFLIITHNKRTMEIADRMYGITMEKAGISKVVSVKFGA